VPRSLLFDGHSPISMQNCGFDRGEIMASAADAEDHHRLFTHDQEEAIVDFRTAKSAVMGEAGRKSRSSTPARSALSPSNPPPLVAGFIGRAHLLRASCARALADGIATLDVGGENLAMPAQGVPSPGVLSASS